MQTFASLFLLGLILVVIGIINIRGNISSVHWYNRKNVSEGDISKYGKCVGTGTLVIGASAIISAVLELTLDSCPFFYVLIAGLAIGLTFIIYGQFKYNKGIF